MNEIIQIRRLARLARDVLIPPIEAEDETTVRAFANADARWHDLYSDFGPLVEGGDILDLTCGSVHLLVRLIDQGARSATGFGAASGNEEGVESLDPEWRHRVAGRLHLWIEYSYLDALEPGSIDIILCDQLDSVFDLGTLETRLARLYDLLRPGGELLVCVQCADPMDLRADGPGYGFMTPTGWSLILLRSGFEIAESRQIWRSPEDESAMNAILPQTRDQERMCRALRFRLLRPWESWELVALNGKQKRAKGKRRRS